MTQEFIELFMLVRMVQLKESRRFVIDSNNIFSSLKHRLSNMTIMMGERNPMTSKRNPMAWASIKIFQSYQKDQHFMLYKSHSLMKSLKIPKRQIRSRKSKKVRQHKEWPSRVRQHNEWPCRKGQTNDLQNTTQKTKDQATKTH